MTIVSGAHHGSTSDRLVRLQANDLWLGLPLAPGARMNTTSRRVRYDTSSRRRHRHRSRFVQLAIVVGSLASLAVGLPVVLLQAWS
jgi:hypothetical protein